MDFVDFYQELSREDIDRHYLLEIYNFASKMHEDQYRKGSGDPYIVHPARVALLLSDCSKELIAAGLLHDTLEDTSASYEQIDELCGSKVADYVTALSKTKSDKQSIFIPLEKVAINDPDIIKVKLADRYDNITDNIEAMSPRTKHRYVHETRDLLEFAQKFGIDFLSSELESEVRKLENHIQENLTAQKEAKFPMDNY